MERVVNPEDCIFFIIAKANQNTQKFWANWISKYNLTVVQAMIINFLSYSGFGKRGYCRD